MLIAGLIQHPDAGLILFETGCAEDIETVNIPGSQLITKVTSTNQYHDAYSNGVRKLLICFLVRNMKSAISCQRLSRLLEMISKTSRQS